jgi:hypothetical protein
LDAIAASIDHNWLHVIRSIHAIAASIDDNWLHVISTCWIMGTDALRWIPGIDTSHRHGVSRLVPPELHRPRSPLRHLSIYTTCIIL